MHDRIKEFIQQEDIASLYELYQHGAFDNAEMQELQDRLVQLSQEKMHQNIVDKAYLKWNDTQDRFALRVLYELALSHYAEEMFYESICEFEILSVLCDDESFSLAMKKHLFALDQELEYDDFVNAWVEHIDETTFFMKDFDLDFEKQFDEHRHRIDTKLEKTKKLFI